MSVNLKTLEADDEIDRTIALLDPNAMTRIEARADTVVALARTASESPQECLLLVCIGNLCTPEDIIAMKDCRRVDGLVVDKWPRI